jgi:hypothetical protein
MEETNRVIEANTVRSAKAEAHEDQFAEQNAEQTDKETRSREDKLENEVSKLFKQTFG